MKNNFKRVLESYLRDMRFNTSTIRPISLHIRSTIFGSSGGSFNALTILVIFSITFPYIRYLKTQLSKLLSTLVSTKKSYVAKRLILWPNPFIPCGNCLMRLLAFSGDSVMRQNISFRTVVKMSVRKVQIESDCSFLHIFSLFLASIGNTLHKSLY